MLTFILCDSRSHACYERCFTGPSLTFKSETKMKECRCNQVNSLVPPSGKWVLCNKSKQDRQTQVDDTIRCEEGSHTVFLVAFMGKHDDFMIQFTRVLRKLA